MQMYNEKGQVRQKEIENTQFEGKKKPRTRQLMLEPWFVLKDIKRNGIKGLVPSGQDSTQLIL